MKVFWGECRRLTVKGGGLGARGTGWICLLLRFSSANCLAVH